jgi:hypothetical protein
MLSFILTENIFALILLIKSNGINIIHTRSIDAISIARDSNDGLKEVYFNQKIVSQWIIKHCELDVPKEVQDKLTADSKAPEKLRSIKKSRNVFCCEY